jgi:hypothetical protein
LSFTDIVKGAAELASGRNQPNHPSKCQGLCAICGYRCSHVWIFALRLKLMLNREAYKKVGNPLNNWLHFKPLPSDMR